MNWLKLDPDNLPPPDAGPFLCTNNLNARDAYGRMSHVYLTTMFHKTSGMEGPMAAFATPCNAMIWNVTHYVVVEAPTGPNG